MADQLVVIGAGGHASEVAAYIRSLEGTPRELQLIGFIDENRPAGPWNGSVVLGNFEVLVSLANSRQDDHLAYITAVGTNLVRERFVQQVERLRPGQLVPARVVHPLASIGPGVRIGAGTCVAPGVIVTTNANIGEHCILNVNVSVSHDSVVGDFCNLNPSVVVCGNVRIGRGCYIGAGATIIQNISIGDGAIIGAGAVVVRDIPACVTAVGVPARITRAPVSDPIESA